MNSFYLPEIERIIVSDYSLYKCPLDLIFSKKLNIVYGTNGTGKSTLLMIILFSIVGPYRGGIRTRVRQEQRRDNRPIYDDSFFFDRSQNLGEQPVVKSFFVINTDRFEVSHSLLDGKLLSVSINNKPLVGRIVSYRTYEDKYSRNRAGELSPDDLSGYLIYKYHDELGKSSCLPGGINTLISMIMDVMFFSEGRNLTFWSEGLQETIIGKYIVDSDFYEKYCAKKLDTKYLESLYKKKSETYNFMRNFFEREKREQTETVKSEDPLSELGRLEKEVEYLQRKLSEKQERFVKQNREVITIVSEEEKLNEKNKQLENLWYENLFPSDYQNFYERFSGLMEEGVCPACGKRHFFPMPLLRCIFCGEDLELNETPDLIKVDIERQSCSNQLMLIRKARSDMEKQLGLLENEISNIKRDIDKHNNRMAELKIEINPNDVALDESDLKRLEKASSDRIQALKEYNESKKTEEEMKKNIENSLEENFSSFRRIFIKYASSFFGDGHKEDVILPFSDSKDELFSSTLIKFKLDGKIREEEYMLSESQRIFTDLAFRFSVLTTFHEKSFFVCETPDSTLDLYHEGKAVKTFLEYISNGNALFISANARRGSLIFDLYNSFGPDDVKVIDLTKISRLSLPSDYSFAHFFNKDEIHE